MGAERRAIGASGLRVYPVGLGAMPMSLDDRPDEEASVRVVCAALDAGIDFVDTADCYCLDDSETGHNERLVCRALAEWKGGSRVIVATKGGVVRPRGAWVHDGRPEHLVRACEASLEALGRDCIDLYQLHAPDPAVSYEDSVGALARLREQGKIRHIGISNVTASQLELAASVVPVASVQNQASPYHPQGLRDGVLELCERTGVAFIPWSPLGGWRAGRIAHEPVLQRVAGRRGATPYQVVLAWLLARSPAVIPIPGASKVSSAVDSAAAPAIRLEPEDVDELDRAFGFERHGT
jgi:aryl-alcohol dehydrogenase-like predicted oxidoreductase